MADKKIISPKTYDILVRPIITEKATKAAESNSIAFEVASDATKGDIKDAIEAIYGVKVKKINVLNAKGKTKKFRGRTGTQRLVKKAYITLTENQAIDVMAGK